MDPIPRPACARLDACSWECRRSLREIRCIPYAGVQMHIVYHGSFVHRSACTHCAGAERLNSLAFEVLFDEMKGLLLMGRAITYPQNDFGVGKLKLRRKRAARDIDTVNMFD
ncbi:hypothetical protein D3C87_459140 [compost metagenome]